MKVKIWLKMKEMKRNFKVKIKLKMMEMQLKKLWKMQGLLRKLERMLLVMPNQEIKTMKAILMEGDRM